jgi:hypothetical protein
VVVRYVPVGEEIASPELTLPVLVNLVSAHEAAGAVRDAEVLEEVVILKAARAQEPAWALADDGRFDAAEQLLDVADVDGAREPLAELEITSGSYLAADPFYSGEAYVPAVRHVERPVHRRLLPLPGPRLGRHRPAGASASAARRRADRPVTRPLAIPPGLVWAAG